MERDGLHVQGKGRHRLPVLTRIQTAGAAWLPGSSASPRSWFQVKITLGLGWRFCFVLKTKREGLQWGRNGYCALFMEFSKLEVSRNSGLKHQQELPLQISVELNDDQALQHLAGLRLLERWQSESSNTPGNVSHLGSISHWASIQYGLPGL